MARKCTRIGVVATADAARNQKDDLLGAVEFLHRFGAAGGGQPGRRREQRDPGEGAPHRHEDHRVSRHVRLGRAIAAR